MLEDYAFPFTDLKVYNGTTPDLTPNSVEVLSEIYKTLQSARITPQTESDFTEMEEIAARWSSYRLEYNTDENDVIVVMSGLYYKYATIPEASFTEGKINREGTVLYDKYVNGVWQNPYQEKETVAIAPPTSVFNTLSFSVMLPNDLFFTNAADEGIVNISADFGNNNGYQHISFNEKISVSYTEAGSYSWRFRFEKWDGQFIEVDVPILIHDPIISLPFPLPGKNNVVIANGKYNATLRIDYAPGSNNKVMKPLIVVEGFDPESILKPEKIGGSTTLNHFLKSIAFDSQLESILKDDTQQYDIIYVDWKNGAGDIRQNAETLIKVIEWVNAEKASNGSTAPNIVLGQSIGGLVATYALRKMEKTAGKNHDTSLFIAHDSPFQGANTPVSTQFLFRHAAATYQSNPFAVFTGEVLIPFIKDLANMMDSKFLQQYSSPGTALGIQDAPAALQMTKYHVTPQNQVTSAHFDNWRNQFNTMGYPQQTRNIAISNGNMRAEPQTVSGGEHMFLLNGSYSTSNILKELLLHLGGSIWGGTTGNWQLGIVSIIPGKAKIDYLVDLRAVPEQNQSTRTVYRGKVRYHVKLWQLFGWSPTISADVISLREMGVSSSVFPMETFAGGTNNLESSVASFVDLPEASFIKPRFDFIPVASALDINRNNGSLTVNDYRYAYNTTAIGHPNLSTPFANFVTERTTGGRANFGHISFSLKNSNWLATELENSTNSTVNYPGNCSYICETTEISGLNNICVLQNNTYSIADPGNNATISWSVSGLQIVSGQGTPNLVVKSTSPSGSKLISVTISSVDCGNLTLNKWVRVGVPTMTGTIDGPTTIHIFKNQNFSTAFTYTAPDAPGVTHYEWIFPGNFQVVSNFGNPLNIPQNWELLGPGNSQEVMAKSNLSTNGQVKVRACNDCGCSDYITLDVTHQYLNTGGPGYELSPNPTTGDILNVMWVGETPSPEFSGNYTNVSIYNIQAQKVHQFEMSREGGSTYVGNLANGIYKVHIDMQDGTFEILNLSISR